MGDTERGQALMALYDRALPQVYGYLLDRCGDRATAEDLTSETFLAAVRASQRPDATDPSVPWLIGVARHKLVDHWRRRGRDERLYDELADQPDLRDVTDPWDAELSALLATDVLRRLGSHHRLALTLRYVDGLPVAEVAALLDRTLHATEALLVRARVAFRTLYEKGADRV
ncbi:MAG: polymerase subunit sigma-24 [Acidimicrobiia bacterium]|nr:polymerase subunit sigma-24 [Acidimicrobiia bacterium]